MNDAEFRDAYERGESIETLGGISAARRLWRIYGGDAAFNQDDPPVALIDIGEWILCNE